MSRDIMATNRDAVLHWLDRFQEELSLIRHAIVEGGDAVGDLFKSTALDRDTFILNPPQRRMPDGPAAPSAQDQIGQLLGGGAYWKLKEMSDRLGKTDDDGSERRRQMAARDD